MQPTSTNGNSVSPREILDSLSRVIERLEADLKNHQDEMKRLRTERDEARFMLTALQQALADRKEWDAFNPADYKLTVDDLLADLRSK